VRRETRDLVTQAQARIRTMTNSQQPAPSDQNEWEQKAAAMIPQRNYRGPGLGIGGTAILTSQEKDDLFQFMKRRAGAYTARTLAEYWANGELTVLEIIDRVEMETGIRDAELIVHQFELLERLGLVAFKDRQA
jgi:hypothetical protein